MEAALVILWGAALLGIVGLLAAVLLGGQRRPRPSTLPRREPAHQPGADSLLFALEDSAGHRTSDGRIWLRLPQAAWQPDWRTDLIRVEVQPLGRAGIRLPTNWGNTRVLHASLLHAFRMTETGQDIEIEQFVAPIEVGMGTDRRERGVLRCALEVDGVWTLPPRANVTVPGTTDSGSRRSWAAALIDRPGRLCLFRLPT